MILAHTLFLPVSKQLPSPGKGKPGLITDLNMSYTIVRM